MTTRDKVIQSILCLALGFLAMEAWKRWHKKLYVTDGLVFRWSADDLKGYANGQPVTNWGSSNVSGYAIYSNTPGWNPAGYFGATESFKYREMARDAKRASEDKEKGRR